MFHHAEVICKLQKTFLEAAVSRKIVFSLLYHKCINYGKIQAAGGSLGTLFKVAASVLDTLLCLICKIERSDSEKFFFVGHFTVD